MFPKNLYVLDCENEPDIRGRYRLHCVDDVDFLLCTFHNSEYRRSPGDKLDIDPNDRDQLEFIYDLPTEQSKQNLPYVIYRILKDLELFVIQQFKRLDFTILPYVSQRIKEIMSSYPNEVYDYRDLSAILQDDVIDVLSRDILRTFDLEFTTHGQRDLWNPDGSSEYEFAEKLNGAGKLLLAAEYYQRSLDRGYHLTKDFMDPGFLDGVSEGTLDEDRFRRCFIINEITESEEPLVAYHLACHYESNIRRNGTVKGVSATKVVDLYKKAGSKGILKAYYRLGNIHQHGLGRMSPNISKAVKAYRRCGDDPDALFKLASCYESTFDFVTEKAVDGVTAKQICDLFRRSAELGNMYARNRMTLDLKDGADPMVFTESKLLAYAGDNYAKYALALCYESGYAGEVSYDKAVKCYCSILDSSEPDVPVFSDTICFTERIPKLYDHDIMYRIGELFELTILNDIGSALEWYVRSAEAGNCKAKSLIDVTDLDDISDHERFRKLMLHSKKGDINILLELATCYESGKGVKRDLSKAKAYRQELADSDHIDSQYWLGSYLERNANSSMEMEFASYWYQKAADNGHEVAKERLDLSKIDDLPESELFLKCRLFMYSDDPKIQFILGRCYESGIGVSTSYYLAKMHYRKAIDLGSTEAKEKLDRSRILSLSGIERYRGLMMLSDESDPEICYHIGMMYLNGDSVERSESLALNWFDSASNLGHMESTMICGDLITSGAVKYNREKALEYYRRAADAGHMECNCKVGRILTEPGSDRKGHPEAVKRLRLSAHSGDAEAQYLLGRMFEKGLGMPQFYSEAYKWYSMSARQGYFEAKYRQMLLSSLGKGTKKDVKKAKTILTDLRTNHSGKLLNHIDRCIRGKDELSVRFKSEFLS